MIDYCRKNKGSFGLLIFALLCLGGECAAEWSTVEPRATDQVLRALCFVDSFNGWVVGDNGTIVRTSDGGFNWFPQESGIEDTLLDVYFTDSLRGWAVGKNGTVVRTEDGGQNWEKLLKRTDANLIGVMFDCSDTGVIVSNESNLLVMRTNDGGSTWSNHIAQSLELYLSGPATGVEFISTTLFYLVGSNGVVYTESGGVNWDVRTPKQTYFAEVYPLTPDTCWAYCYSGGYYFTNNAGLNWLELGQPQIRGGDPDEPQFAFWDAMNGAMVALSRGTYLATTKDGGKTWTEDPNFPVITEFLCFLSYDKRGNIWTGGQYGALYTCANRPTTSLASARLQPTRLRSTEKRISILLSTRQDFDLEQERVFDMRGRAVGIDLRVDANGMANGVYLIDRAARPGVHPKK